MGQFESWARVMGGVAAALNADNQEAPPRRTEHSTARARPWRREFVTPRPSTGPRLTTLQDAWRETGIPVSTLRDLGLQGVVAVVRVPGRKRWFLDRGDIETLIDRSKTVRTD
jgi:hypothetical protein